MHIMGERSDMYYNDVLDRMMPKASAYESAIIVARQNGKGAILEAVELAWLYLLGVRTIVHSSHEFPTSREHFLRMESLISNTPMLKAELARGGIKWSHGDESINLATGQRLLFKTRTKGAVRGFSPDKIVFDEAMKLKPEHVAAMKYAASARPDAQFIYTGSASSTANRQAGESAHFGRARRRGITGEDARLFFAEWSADVCTDFCPSDCGDHDDPGDPATWRKANPGIGYRIQEENVLSEYLGDPREIFLQERLSVGDWPMEESAWAIIDEQSWRSRADEESMMKDDTFVLAVDVEPNSKHSCISAAGLNFDGMTHVEITGYEELDYLPGITWVPSRVLAICKAMKPKAVVIQKIGQAGGFIDELEEPLTKMGIEILSPNATEFAQACGEFYAGVIPQRGNKPSLVHIDQVPLTAAVAGADKRDLEGSWAWSKRNSAVDISPLVACTLAVWGFKKYQYLPKASAPWVARR